MPSRYWEDIAEGERLECRPVLFDRSEMLEFAKKYDPQSFHTDERAAQSSLFRGLVASSLHTLAACTRAVVEAQAGLAILSGVGMDAVEMLNPVRPGDVLFIEAQWTDLKRSQGDPRRGSAGLRCKVFNQRGEPVLDYGYRYLVACRDRS